MQSILGQARAIELLSRSLTSGKLHHAFIFHGPPGVGKFTTALALARVLLCHNPRYQTQAVPLACETCPSCALLSQHQPVATPTKKPGKKTQDDDSGYDPVPNSLTQSAHPDLHIVTKELARFDKEKTIRDRKLINIPVEVLRQHLLTPAYRTASLEHGKVLIIDEAELIDLVGQNLLLKTLEEPPAGHTFILITSQEDKLLPTIRSRCQRIPFTRLAPQHTAAWLDRQNGIEKLTPTQRQWLLDFSDGSVGRLDLALRYNLVDWAREILPRLEEFQRDEFPVELGATFARLLGEFAELWVKHHGQTASKDAANRLGANLLFSMLSQWACRNMSKAAEQATPGNMPELDALLEPWLDVIERIQHAEAQLASSLNLGMICDHLALHLFVNLRRVPRPGLARP